MAPAGFLAQRKLPVPPRHREQRLRASHYVPVDPIPWCRTSRIRSLKTPSRFVRPYYNECRWRRRRQAETKHKSHPPPRQTAAFADTLQMRDADSSDLRRIAIASASPPACRGRALRQRSDRLGNGGHHVFSGYANAGQALCRRPRRPRMQRRSKHARVYRGQTLRKQRRGHAGKHIARSRLRQGRGSIRHAHDGIAVGYMVTGPFTMAVTP